MTLGWTAPNSNSPDLPLGATSPSETKSAQRRATDVTARRLNISDSSIVGGVEAVVIPPGNSVQSGAAEALIERHDVVVAHEVDL
jgi:hypothetical protein